MIGETEQRRIRFGPFDFDPGTRQLRREGVPVRLQPQPAQVLAILVRRPGEVILRDALREELWGTETYVDFNRGLNFCVAQIRTALGDSAESPLYIKTLPKRGYQFIAPVAAPPELPPPEATLTRSRELPRNTRWRLPAVVGLIAMLAMVTFWALRAPKPEAVVAIARFENFTGDPGLDPLAESLLNSVIVELTSRNRFAVIGNAAILREGRATRDLLEIHRTLHADRIVLGSLERGKDAPEVLLQFISLPGQVHLKATRTKISGEPSPSELASKLTEALLTGPYRTR